MGRLFIELDPDGYYRLEEVGRTERWTGAELAGRLPDQGATYKLRHGNFWNPPGTEWLLPKPRQFQPDWYKDGRLGDHLLRMSAWTFASGLGARTEYARAKKPSGNVTSWFWTRFFVPETGVSSLDTRNYPNIGTACGITLPTSLKTVAVCSQAPNGDLISDGLGDLSPWFGFRQFPVPDDVLLFGWGDCVVLFTLTTWYFLRSPNNDGVSWNLEASGPLEGKGPSGARPGAVANFGEGFAAPVSTMEPVDRLFMAVPVGLTEVWLSFERAGEEVVHEFRKAGDTGSFWKAGSWWIAAPGGVTVDFQAQVVGYETASTDGLNVPNPLTFFDLGVNYLPTVNPKLTYNVAMHRDPATETLNTATANNEYTITVTGGAPASTERTILGVYDEGYLNWVSDGTHHKGSLRLHLRPDTAQRPGYLAPQIQFVALRFPEKRTARPRDALASPLNDTQWAALSCTTYLRDPGGKRITFAVWDRHEQLLQSKKFDRREGYPVHILEDMDADGIGDTIRARGWVYDVRLRELKTESTDDAGAAAADKYPARLYTFEARGLLGRADEGWLFAPNIVDPDGGGFLEHDYAIKEALRLTGFDVTDAAFFSFYADPQTGTAVAQLPGTSEDLPAVGGMKNDGPYNPDWTEPKVRYMQRIAEEWRGWLLYENETLIRYHPDLGWAVIIGEQYYRSGTIYRTRAEATAANAAYPHQFFRAEPERITPRIPCNAVRVSGKDPGEKSPDPNRVYHVIDKDLDSISGAPATVENFLGEERVLSVVSKLAVGDRALSQIARIIRRRKSRRMDGNSIVVRRKMPWEFSGTLAIGRVWEIKGKGDHLVTQLEWSVIGKGPGSPSTYVPEVRIVGEKLVSTATRGTTDGAYPGQGTTPPP